EELQAVLRGNFAADGAFAALLNTKIAERVWQVLQQFEQKEKLRLPDAGFLTLAIHCTLTVQQLREQGGSSAAVHPPENAAQRLGAALGQAFGLTLPTEEVQYLEQYLAAYITGDDGEKWGAGEMYLRHLTGRLISEVERAMRVNFSGYASLRDNLFTHLRPMLLRVREQIHMDNPQLDTIQREYPQLWAATRAACDTVEMELALPHIPDSEAAYLAMHFGAVLEQNGALRQAARVVVACPLGMSSSRFLASRIEGEFPTLKVDGCCSVRELDPEQLHSRGIDLVIATVPLELAYPSITVNPALLEPDRALLRDAVQRLNGTVRTGTPAEPSAASAAEGGLRYTYRLTRSMVQMLDHLCIRTVCKPVSRQGLIDAASRLFCPNEDASRLVAQQLRRREAMGDTYIKPLFALLLHCRTKAVSDCRFGYLQAQPPVYEAGKMIMGAFVLLAPDTDDPIPVEVMRMVSAQLIEEPELIERLRTGQRDAAVQLLEEKLDRLFSEHGN
ncbi:MAG: PRD domain-containing protein, partial [Butyricicoccus sp.]